MNDEVSFSLGEDEVPIETYLYGCVHNHCSKAKETTEEISYPDISTLFKKNLVIILILLQLKISIVVLPKNTELTEFLNLKIPTENADEGPDVDDSDENTKTYFCYFFFFFLSVFLVIPCAQLPDVYQENFAVVL